MVSSKKYSVHRTASGAKAKNESGKNKGLSISSKLGERRSRLDLRRNNGNKTSLTEKLIRAVMTKVMMEYTTFKEKISQAKNATIKATFQTISTVRSPWNH
jgi:hypothetical protein